MKFRKKPVVVEATQWFKMGDHPAVFMQDSYKQAKISPSVTSNKVPVIKTLEGDHLVTPGDWIITGVKGEHYPCKPDIFEMTYEKVEARGEQWDELAIQEGIRKPWETLLMMTKTPYGLYAFTHKDLERFAALVAAHEREACAKVCDVLAVHPEYASDITKVAAQASRSRGEQ